MNWSRRWRPRTGCLGPDPCWIADVGSAYDAGMSIAKPAVVSASEWQSSVAALRAQEERLAAVLEETAAARKRMPMVLVEDEYLF